MKVLVYFLWKFKIERKARFSQPQNAQQKVRKCSVRGFATWSNSKATWNKNIFLRFSSLFFSLNFVFLSSYYLSFLFSSCPSPLLFLLWIAKQRLNVNKWRFSVNDWPKERIQLVLCYRFSVAQFFLHFTAQKFSRSHFVVTVELPVDIFLAVTLGRTSRPLCLCGIT